MSVVNAQSILSSRMHTGNMFKVTQNDSRKMEPIQRDKLSIDVNSIKYQVVDGKPQSNDEDNNYNINDKNKQKNNSYNKHIDEFDYDHKTISFDDKILKSNQNTLSITFNRLLYSNSCVYFYVGLILVSIIVFVYSIYCYFAKLNELPILICEGVLIAIATIDMLIRISQQGCKLYFSKCINWMDVVLLCLSVITLFLYLQGNYAQRLEDISFALLIFIRNSSQLLRLAVLLKNQKEVRKNIEEIIHFSSDIIENKAYVKEDKDSKNNKAILSFVDGNNSIIKSKRNFQSQNLTHFPEIEINGFSDLK